MPVYTFFCENCKKFFEKNLPSKERNKKQICPFCGSKKTKREFSLPQIKNKKGSSCLSCSSKTCSTCPYQSR